MSYKAYHIKPLAWSDTSPDGSITATPDPFISYAIAPSRAGRRWKWYDPNGDSSCCDSVDEAKAACEGNWRVRASAFLEVAHVA